MWDYPVGTIRTGGGMLAPSDTAFRIFSVHFRCSTTPSNIVFDNVQGTVTVTTPASVLLTVENTGATVGDWDSSYGVLFSRGVFIQTTSAVTMITIAGRTEKI